MGCTLELQAGARVRRRRWHLGTSLSQLSAAVGVSMVELRAYENGEEKIDGALLDRIARALNVNPDFLRDG